MAALISSKTLHLLTLLVVLAGSEAAAAACDAGRVKLQMLGTRGPELLDGRASTGYLLWLDGSARNIIDAGSGTVQRFEQSGAHYEYVDLILFTHFHVDHSADFPAYIKGGFFTDRDKPLTVIGPSGNRLVPSADQFVERLLGVKTGVYPYLGDYPGTGLPDRDRRLRDQFYRGHERTPGPDAEAGPRFGYPGGS